MRLIDACGMMNAIAKVPSTKMVTVTREEMRIAIGKLRVGLLTSLTWMAFISIPA